MKKIIIFVFVFALLAITGCKTNKETPTEERYTVADDEDTVGADIPEEKLDSFEANLTGEEKYVLGYFPGPSSQYLEFILKPRLKELKEDPNASPEEIRKVEKEIAETEATFRFLNSKRYPKWRDSIMILYNERLIDYYRRHPEGGYTKKGLARLDSILKVDKANYKRKYKEDI